MIDNLQELALQAMAGTKYSAKNKARKQSATIRKAAMERIRGAATITIPEQELVFEIICQAIRDADGVDASHVNLHEYKDAIRFFDDWRFDCMCGLIHADTEYCRKVISDFFPWGQHERV